ncbi:MAG: dienelactone hydrolase family protein, partial [Alphaproteobacteria bacterium]
MGSAVNLTAGDSHSFHAWLAEPSGAPRFGLVVVQEIFGVNDHIRGLVDGFARDGIFAVAPALFDRVERGVERGVELGYDGDSVARGRELRGRLGWDGPLRDIAAAARIARIGGKVGVVGYCWGGSLAWLSAARLAGTIDAAVGY